MIHKTAEKLNKKRGPKLINLPQVSSLHPINLILELEINHDNSRNKENQKYNKKSPK